MWGPYYRLASVNVTNPGWYIVNFLASKGRASLKRFDPTSNPPYVAVTQWDNSASANQYESYPVVVNLAAGYHYFYWIPEAGYFWLSEVSLMKL